MGFSGYPRGIQPFFQELKTNNTKEWFDANRDRFDELVMEPSIQFVAAMAEPLGKLDPALNAEPKLNRSIRRIFRDTRFSKDKTPYHTHLHLIFFTGSKPNETPGFHLVLGDEHFGYGGGHWAFASEALERFRHDVATDEGRGVAGAVVAVEKSDKRLELDPPDLKTVPKGFDRDHRWAGWARYKGLVMRTHGLDYPDEIFGPEAVEYVAGLCRSLQPLTKYLTDRVFS